MPSCRGRADRRSTRAAHWDRRRSASGWGQVWASQPVWALPRAFWPPPPLVLPFPFLQPACSAAFGLRAVSAEFARMRWPPASGNSRGSISDAGVSCPALSLLRLGIFLGFVRRRGVRLPDRLLDLDQRRLGAARIGPDEIADQDEVRSGSGEFGSLVALDGKAYAGRLEQFSPPLQALGDRLHRRPLPACVGFAEQ